MNLNILTKNWKYLVSFIFGLVLGCLLLVFMIDNHDYNSIAKETEKNSSFDSYSSAVKKASPAVVNIYSEKIVKTDQRILPFSNRFNSIFGPNRSRIEASLGSGVIFSSDGYILTNQHVIGDISLGVTVELSDGRKEEAVVVGIDKGTDLAVLKVSQDHQLPSIEIGNSDDLNIGDIVLAIGNPYGLGQSVSMGIVSATGREFNNPYLDYIQTDASINKGNSGGALIDTLGRLVGINTLIRSSSGGSEGVGLAIPSVTALAIINDLIQFGEVKRGWVGFGIDRKALALKNILVISSIHAKGPAKKIGLKVGDEIIGINEQKSSYSLLFKEFVRSKPGTLIRLKILRGNQNISFDLITSET